MHTHLIPLSLALAALTSAIPQFGRDRNGGGGGGGLSGGNEFNEAAGACQDVTVVFARGTTEGGNVGALVGPPFFDALESAGLSIARQGVNDYPADVAGFLAGGSDTGAANMVELVDEVSQRCPDTMVVMSGYSQGAQVARKAAAEVQDPSRVGAVVLFGDPLEGESIDGFDQEVLTICNNGDLICNGQSLILPPHLTYNQRVDEGAEFVVAAMG